jgi:signal transduction histidine kinase
LVIQTAFAQTQFFWQHAVQEKDWRNALDFLIQSLRDSLVFDNLAIFMIDKQGETSEIAYARAIGREKNAEADANWGEAIATEAIARNEIVLQKPNTTDENEERSKNAYLIGLPMKASGKLIGAMSLIRFGGPDYTQAHIDLANLASDVVAYIFEKRALQETIAELEAVQRQMRLQDDFVSTISHELRTPLGFIKGYSTTLLREDTEWDEETQREFLTIIDEETDHLTELLNNVLNSARLESETAEMDFQPVRLDIVIRDVITRTHAHHQNVEINFESRDCEYIHGDSPMLTQIFENLFSNAIKYAPDTPIDILIHQINPQEMQVVFADHGNGIPKDHLAYIFDRFYRVPGMANAAGTGLGLYICKQIIEAHHGKMWAESEAGAGTRFIIQFPILKLPAINEGE